jgi:hypothetical protein
MDLRVHFRRGMNKISRALLAAFATLVTACGTPDAAPVSAPNEAPFARPAGYWEGKGTLQKTDMKDDFRHLQRKAEFTFWFVLDKSGLVNGEVEILYDATLTVSNLPELSVSVPGVTGTMIPGGSLAFQPKVGGKVTDPNPRRRFRLHGQYDGALTLAVGGLEEAAPIQFTVRGDAGLGGGIGTPDAGGFMLEKPKTADDVVLEMPMKPYSPFIEPANVEKRPHGPHTSRYEVNDPTLSVYWTATQVTNREERR